MPIKELDKEDFSEEIAKGQVLVDFWAVWCTPCRVMHPILDKVSEDGYNVLKVDVDAFRTIQNQNDVQSIPTVIRFDDGKEIARAVGAMTKVKLYEKLGLDLPA